MSEMYPEQSLLAFVRDGLETLRTNRFSYTRLGILEEFGRVLHALMDVALPPTPEEGKKTKERKGGDKPEGTLNDRAAAVVRLLGSEAGAAVATLLGDDETNLVVHLMTLVGMDVQPGGDSGLYAEPVSDDETLAALHVVEGCLLLAESAKDDLTGFLPVLVALVSGIRGPVVAEAAITTLSASLVGSRTNIEVVLGTHIGQELKAALVDGNASLRARSDILYLFRILAAEGQAAVNALSEILGASQTQALLGLSLQAPDRAKIAALLLTMS